MKIDVCSKKIDITFCYMGKVYFDEANTKKKSSFSRICRKPAHTMGRRNKF